MKNLKIPYSKFINKVASTTFGVLLIHTNSDAMRKWLWKDLLDNFGMYNSPYLLIHAICSVLGIFILCTIVDLLRIKFIEKPFFKVWDKKWPHVVAFYQKYEKEILNKLNVK